MNQFHILNDQNDSVAYFMRCYFNDIFGSTIFLLFLNLVHSFLIKKNVVSFYHVELLMLICGVLWEFLTPLYRSDTTTDIIDIFAYLLGGVIYWYILGRKYFKKQDI